MSDPAWGRPRRVRLLLTGGMYVSDRRGGHVRRLFPGGNTGYGFHSFYDYIVSPDARKIFVIKGGPGVGKSSFMRKIGEELLQRGFDIEFHHCSSDNGSLDGVYAPDLDIALIDGTAPHIVDPKNPGAVDEIVHLGDYWDEAGMRRNREPILHLNREVGRLFRRAYDYLRQVLTLSRAAESYYVDADVLDIAGLNAAGRKLVADVVGGHTADRVPKARHLFASAITPDGPLNYFDTVFDALDRRVIINGKPGTGKTTLVRKVYDQALAAGFDVEAFHCALDPQKIDHVVIPALSVAVINSQWPHPYAPRPGDVVIDTNEYVRTAALEPYRAEMARVQDDLETAMERAVGFIHQAKRTHDEMESYYVPNMHFEEINARRDRVLQRILELAEQG